MRFLEYMSTRIGRAIRAVFGLALIAVGVVLGGNWVALAVFGLLPLATAVFDVCPVSVFFGGTCRSDSCSPR
ncbi:DUF2892 domain-containing protein [Actinospica sp. MGRD01-02]|uniref:DUF2892 domain-containing protein n=1 Tax=Actinospica acidithermotolerans TaxID=2828514 RepID=A0A941EF13_9ACTN|nr:DUF2892 domain-containing protein [Actinospica acidithermotolerans]MBR7829297.1 DUF2892 domain-containing protein [Actinospica acidithermotolerans]